MTYKLFYAHDSAAMVVRVLLEDIGAEYELIDTTIAKDVPRHADHLALNPNGWVPVLAWEGRAMYEAAAITIYLTDLYPNARLGPALDDPDRPLFLQTLVYFSNTVQTAFQQYYYAERFAEDEAGCAGAMARGVRRLRDVWQVVEDQIGDNPWTVGTQLTAVDVYLYMLTTWLDPDGGHPKVTDFPNVARIADKVAQHPSVKEVYGV
ncbi:MAG: glutathione S-transferase family protein [Pseudomonadota bacterium]